SPRLHASRDDADPPAPTPARGTRGATLAPWVTSVGDDLTLLRFTVQEELVMMLRVLVAGLAGGIIGFERQYSGKKAGIRTVLMVSTGSGIFTVVSIFGFNEADSARVAAQVASGVGFLGAGTI